MHTAAPPQVTNNAKIINIIADVLIILVFLFNLKFSFSGMLYFSLLTVNGIIKLSIITTTIRLQP